MAVGTYDELLGPKGDNLTPHHVPSAKHMEVRHNVPKGEGIAINMEHPHPGVGGRHRETFTYGNTADVDISSRDALAAGVRDLRRIYQRHDLYDLSLTEQLQMLIRANKEKFVEAFQWIR